MTRRLVTSLVLVCALSAAAPAVVIAQSSDTASAAITDCNDHGTLTAHYSVDTLRTALATMPADVREYTDCYDVIEKQLFAQLGTSGTAGTTTTGSSSGGSVLPTWLIVVIVVLALAALTFGALAIRRRRLETSPGPDSTDASAPDSPDAGGVGSSGPAEPTEPGSPPPSQEAPDDPGGSGGAGGPQ
jgi:hypothetical protein